MTQQQINLNVGVLALQGAFHEHVDMLKRLNTNVTLVKTCEDLRRVDSLIIPGGESTTMGIVSSMQEGFLEELKKFTRKKPTWGTCAGMIFLADKLENQKKDGQIGLGGLHCTVSRNHFGSQIESFTTQISVSEWGEDSLPIRAVFIRAPIILQAGEDVRVIARLKGGEIVAAVQGNILVTSFHPELTEDTRWHRYFIEMANQILKDSK
eukprot:TRINITY_DN13872_c0_g1_i1.p1 TRINITY_DN13872_c0_g1~~TRINITY_DN13872_c0_g1_i1.p1  ORF type:complete len:209 (-),score=58.54 TRINITY_DN13872_c0_g1_i1:197-823(-)